MKLIEKLSPYKEIWKNKGDKELYNKMNEKRTAGIKKFRETSRSTIPDKG